MAIDAHRHDDQQASRGFEAWLRDAYRGTIGGMKAFAFFARCPEKRLPALLLLALAALSSSPSARGTIQGRALGPAVEGPRPIPIVPGVAVLISPGVFPRRFARIQDAVDAAVEGDVIRLTDGVFRGPGNRGIAVSGKNLRIESFNGAAACVIDCEKGGRGFSFTGSAVTSATVLREVTIIRGVASLVGPFGFGGGIFVDIDCYPTIEGCILLDCDAGGGGGIAYHHFDTDPLGIIRGCTIQDCYAGDEGGAIRGFSVLIERCTIVDNHAFESGGGVFLRLNGILRDSIIARNTVTTRLFPTIGGGVLAWDLTRIEGCTIVDNVANFGGGLAAAFGPGVVVSNCILWGNRAKVPAQGDQVYTEGGSSVPDLVLRYCNIEGGIAGVGGFPGPTALLSETLEVDPEFVDPATGDYHLRSTSPLIDAGDPDFFVQALQGDLDNEPRANGRTDVGADEWYPGPALSYPSPARAGETNVLRVRGARPGAIVIWWVGSSTGPSPSLDGCPDLSISSGQPVALALADAQGNAEVREHAPASLAGTTISVQALEMTLAGATSCIASNVVTFGFP